MSSAGSPGNTNFAPATAAELARFVAENARGERRPLYPVGGRTSLHYGYPVSSPGVLVSLAKLDRVIDYPARDMTITAEAGIRLDDLQRTLAAERQQLPVDVPQSHRATLGGAVAANAAGPRRYGYGTLRDYVIGVSAVDGRGRLFQAGGRVVKNVAGYDLCKLMVGSLGTLAVIAQLTLKLRPLPERTAVLWLQMPSFKAIDAALERLLTSATRPVALGALSPSAAGQIAAEARAELPAKGPVLAVGVEGLRQDVNWQIEQLRSELSAFEARAVEVVAGPQAGKLYHALTDFEVGTDEPLTFKANLPASATVEFLERAAGAGISLQAHAGNGIVIGHLPDEAATAARAAALLDPLRDFARRRRGNLIVLSCERAWKERLAVFGEPEPAQPLMRRLKKAFDPHGLLNPGRFGLTIVD